MQRTKELNAVAEIIPQAYIANFEKYKKDKKAKLLSYKQGIPLSLLVKVIVVLALIDILLIFVLNTWYKSRIVSDPLIAEIHKSLIQFLVVFVIGTIVSFFIKGNDAHKATEKGLDQFRKALLTKLHKYYADTKRIRRVLRATACTPPFNYKSGDKCMISMSKYDEQLIKLNDIQLDLEILKKELNDLPAKIFKSRSETRRNVPSVDKDFIKDYDANKILIVSSIRFMENYLTKIIEEWEEKGGYSKQKSEINIDELPALKQFIKPAKEDFRTNFISYYGNSLEVIRASILFPFTS